MIMDEVICRSCWYWVYVLGWAHLSTVEVWLIRVELEDEVLMGLGMLASACRLAQRELSGCCACLACVAGTSSCTLCPRGAYASAGE